MTEDERLEIINQLSNGYGMHLLDLVDGDWDLARSVAVALLASTLAQAALARKEDFAETVEEALVASRGAAEAFYEKLSQPAQKALTTKAKPAKKEAGTEEQEDA